MSIAPVLDLAVGERHSQSRHLILNTTTYDFGTFGDDCVATVLDMELG